jgi:hypothetical protein
LLNTLFFTGEKDALIKVLNKEVENFDTTS